MMLFIMVSTNNVWAQFYSGMQMDFGKNRVQYDDERTWLTFRFTEFDVYFYQGGKELAIYASSYASQQIDLISKKLSYSLETKVRFIVFNDLSDLKETNLGLITGEDYTNGNSTFIIDNKIFIYFNGNHADFENQIRKGLAGVFMNEILYGGSTTSKIKNSILLSLPKWFTEGFVSYMAEGWNTDIDNKVRQGITTGKFKDFRKLTATEQAVAGHALWKYIEEKYGESVISEVLYMAKMSRSIESGIIYVLSISYDELITNWLDHYAAKYLRDLNAGYIEPQNNALKRTKTGVTLTSSRLSPDGKYLVYAENNIGRVKIRIKDINSGKRKTIKKFGYKLDEKVDLAYPVMAWAPTSNFLSIFMEEKGKNILLLFDMPTKTWTKRYMLQFDKVLSCSYNDKANQLVISAIISGQTDIFIYNIGANTVSRITNDIYDDLNPSFANNSSSIIFASNRPSDTLKFDVETGKNITRDTLKGMNFNDIFMYDIIKKSNILYRITRTHRANESMPLSMGFNKFAWLSDETGINNRVFGAFDSTISYIDTMVHYRYFTKSWVVTNFIQGIREHSYNKASSTFIDVINDGKKDNIYFTKIANFDNEPERKVGLTAYIKELISKEKELAMLRQKHIADSVARANDTTSRVKVEPIEKQPAKRSFKVLYVGENQDKESEVDINDYKVDKNPNSAPAPTVDKTPSKQTSEMLFRPLNFKREYSINDLVAQLDFNYMSYSYQTYLNSSSPIYVNNGLTYFTKFGVMDILEDYRLVGGVNAGPLLKNNEWMLSFSDLKKRIDKEYVFHRNVIDDFSSEGFYYRHYVHDVFLKFNFPINNVKGFRSTVILRNDKKVPLSLDNFTAALPVDNLYHAGLKLEFVFDNTRNIAVNQYFGTRYKLFAEYYQRVDDLKKNTYVVGLDFRNYTKIFRNLVWANRLAGSSSFGQERLLYYMGGMDGWLFPKFNDKIQVDQKTNWVYQTLATNLRGFDQNIRNGNNFLVINSEIRLPIFTFFSRRPIKSSFLSNFMIIGFGDLGTAWTGINPFSDSNSLFVQTFYSNPITVTVVNQNDPLVGGFGFGVRSLLFGYYIRADWAWGMQNGILNKSKFYLSVSYDF